MTKKGFTLVELSIVLVIIGLLIGGILVAQSMIKSAQINAFVRQLQQYDSAVTNFKTKYNNLPGDSPYFPTNGCNDAVTYGSQGDGKITDANAGNRYVCNEIGNFWSDLSIVGLSESYTAVGVDEVVTIGTNVPKSALGSKTAAILALTGEFDTQVDDASCGDNYMGGQNYYAIFDAQTFITHTNEIRMQNAIDKNDALAVDSKIDDGVGTSGYVRGYDLTDGLQTSPTPLMCSHTLTNGENVSYSAAAEKRILAIKIGAFTGVNE